MKAFGEYLFWKGYVKEELNTFAFIMPVAGNEENYFNQESLRVDIGKRLAEQAETELPDFTQLSEDLSSPQHKLGISQTMETSGGMLNPKQLEELKEFIW